MHWGIKERGGGGGKGDEDCWVSELKIEYDGKVNGVMVFELDGARWYIEGYLGEEGWDFFLRLVMYHSVWETW